MVAAAAVRRSLLRSQPPAVGGRQGGLSALRRSPEELVRPAGPSSLWKKGFGIVIRRNLKSSANYDIIS